MGQENSSIHCGDGIDNDGDGLVDCMDNDCMALPNNGCQICSDGISFADVLIEYIPGCLQVDPIPEGATGVADWNGQNFDVPEIVFLGQGGSIKLGFTNNYIVNSGDNQLDLWVFEVGTAVESSDLALRPLDAFTTNQLINLGIPDNNADGYYEVGNIAGSTSGLDIDAVIPGYSLGQLKFDAIEIRDVPDVPCSSTTTTPGADIDAVCALTFLVVDCAGIINGTAVIDECGLCLEPTDPNFNQACADCNGIPNGSAIIDECGICLEPTDPNFNQACADCAGTPNGNAIIDACGICLEPTDPNFNQSCLDCAGTINGTAIIDECGVCLEPTDPNFNQACADCNGTPNGTAIIDECGICLEPTDPNFNQACADCAGTPNGTAIIDECGICLEPTDPNFNQACADCTGTPNGTAVIDECGICLEPTDPNFNQACADCAGTPNGNAIFDACGICLEPTDPDFNQACADCAGTPNGTAIIDACDVCLEPNDPNFNQSCLDCTGNLNGTAVIDECGNCLEITDPNFNQACADCNGTPNGLAIIDECGDCYEVDQPGFNQSCADCNGIPNGLSLLNDCGECIETSDPFYNLPCSVKYQIFIPNVFSPNGDGLNDLFEIHAATGAVQEIILYQIFDRWGGLIYQKENFNMEFNAPWWDGRYKLKRLTPAVFVYKINVLLGNGNFRTFTGDVTLVR